MTSGNLRWISSDSSLVEAWHWHRSVASSAPGVLNPSFGPAFAVPSLSGGLSHPTVAGTMPSLPGSP